MFAAPEEAAMQRQFDRDPTEFFSVVGAPYVRERPSAVGENDRDLDRTESPGGRRVKIGVAAMSGLCAVILGISLFAASGAGRLVEVAYRAVQ
jgi:hypothetical protein